MSFLCSNQTDKNVEYYISFASRSNCAGFDTESHYIEVADEFQKEVKRYNDASDMYINFYYKQ